MISRVIDSALRCLGSWEAAMVVLIRFHREEPTANQIWRVLAAANIFAVFGVCTL